MKPEFGITRRRSSAAFLPSVVMRSMLSDILLTRPFLTASALGFVLMLIFEHPVPDEILRAAWPLLYLGVLSTGTAYTLQIIGQRGLNPTIASLIMSLESTISTIAGYVFLHQTLTPRELAGCVLMAVSIVLAQLA